MSAYFLEDLKHTRVGQKELFVMNLGHLQVFVNDLHTQIESKLLGLIQFMMSVDVILENESESWSLVGQDPLCCEEVCLFVKVTPLVNH